MAFLPIIAHFMPIAAFAPHRIEILAFQRAQLLDVTGPAQVFATANDLTPAGEPKPYEIDVVSAQTAVVTSSGIVLKAIALPNRDVSLGTLIVSGGYGVDDACRDVFLVDWIRQRAGSASRVASVCSGAILLLRPGFSTVVGL